MSALPKEASRDARGAAFFVDLLLRLGPFCVLGGAGIALEDAELVHLAPRALALSILVFTVIDVIGLAWRGQTLGKRWMGIYVARSNGERASFLRVVMMRTFLPNTITALPYLGVLWFFLDYLWALGPERRAVHDRISDTAVFVR